MESQTLETSEEWAEQQFGNCQLGDRRRTNRAVVMGAAMLRAPGESLPRQMKSWAKTKAAYRFMDTEEIEYQDLIKPHWEQTRAKMLQLPLVLLIQDLTELDYTRFDAIGGLGPIGDGNGRGLLMSTVLGVQPNPRQVLGIVYQEPFLRKPNPLSPQRDRRPDRPKETDFWVRSVQAIGACLEGQVWVHVGDRGSDLFPFLLACRENQCHFLIRAYENRKILTPAGKTGHLIDFARKLPAQEERCLHLKAGHGHPDRDAQVKMAFCPIQIASYWLDRKGPSLEAWVIRVWEENPPEGVEEPIDWYLLTSVPTETLQQAWERVKWYACRWLVEDFHQCLKTGCQVETHRLQSKDRLLRLLGLLSPIAVHLLSLRERARLEPDRLAQEVVEADLLRLIAHLSHLETKAINLQTFWRLVAQQGGYLGRKRDGPPGWKSLWAGWLYLQDLLTGFHLAKNLGP